MKYAFVSALLLINTCFADEYKVSDDYSITLPKGFIELLKTESYHKNELYKHPDIAQKAAIQALFDTIDDPYAEYITKEKYNTYVDKVKSNKVIGIGAYIFEDRNEHELIIIDTIKGSPAAKNGLLKGDVITKIDNKKVATMTLDDALELIKGGADTPITIEIKRGNTLFEKTMMRKKVAPEAIKMDILTTTTHKKIGYIKLQSFLDNTPNELYTALVKDKTKYDMLVLDMRNNPGGLIKSAVQVMEMLSSKGETLMYMTDKDTKKEIQSSKNGALRTFDKPIYVLQNRYTASASEILSSYLQHKNAVIIGETSYGKGSAQRTYTLPDGDFVKLTFSLWYDKSGNSIDKKGIKPDVEIIDMTPFDDNDDVMNYLLTL